MSTAPVLDAHVHLWDWQLADYDWMDDSMSSIRRPVTVDELAETFGSHGVTSAVLVQTCPSLQETREYLHLAAVRSEVAGVVGWVDLTDPGIFDVLASLREAPGGDRLVGIRHQVHDEPDATWLDRPDVRRGIAAVGEEGLVFDLLVRVRELPAATRLVEQLPDQRFVLDHLAKPQVAAGALEPWAGRLTALGRHEQVACKLSGLITEADWHSWSVDDLRPPGSPLERSRTSQRSTCCGRRPGSRQGLAVTPVTWRARFVLMPTMPSRSSVPTVSSTVVTGRSVGWRGPTVRSSTRHDDSPLNWTTANVEGCSSTRPSRSTV